MAATLHVLHPASSPIAAFLRVGYTGQKKLEALQAAGRLPYRRIVFDAAHLAEQVDLLKLLKAGGCEIVLDPNFAEMATAGRFGTAVGRLPWANPGRPWCVADFGPGRNRNLARLMAEFCVRHGVNVILAPTHLLDVKDQPWQAIDLRFCELLRHELDQEGGHRIAIDYQLITTMTLLKDAIDRQQMLAGIVELPIENIWLRVSGFGAAATGAATRHFTEAVRVLHTLHRPLVADFVGGYAGLASAAFGAVAGISHGVGQKENFRASDWKTPPTGGGQSRRVYVEELDRYFTEVQLDQIFSARMGRSRLGCNDTSCCRDGCDDMIENAHAHFITRPFRQIDSLSGIPEAIRPNHFLRQQLDPAVRSARYASRLKIVDEKTKKLVEEAKARLIRVRDALDDLHSRESTSTYSQPVAFRGGGGTSISAVLGR